MFSPCTTTAGLGFAPGIAQAERPALLRALLAAFEADARREGCGLFASKDVVEADRPLWDAAATPLGLHLRGRPAKLVTRGYHLYALPTAMRRIRVALDWALAGRRPDDVSLGMSNDESALITHAEHNDG